MNAIIDFNGFYNSGNEYVIKEYSIWLIRNATNEVLDDWHRVSKPPIEWKALSDNEKIGYKTYYGTYGIAWETGTHDKEFIVNELWDTLRNTRIVCLLYKGKREMLASYLGDNLGDFQFQYIKKEEFELKPDFKPDLSTECRYHKHPSKNNCANDNVSKMVELFVERNIDLSSGNFNIVIDFNGWYFTDEQYMIKEYAMYFVHNKTNQVIFRDNQVSEAPVPWDKLDEFQLNEWKVYYRDYGIEWDRGTHDTEFIKSNLKDKFRWAKKIFVRDRKKYNLLKKYLTHDFNATYLTDLNLIFEDNKATKCRNHTQRHKNNCANDNALKMIELLSQTLNQAKLNIVIDFNGCDINNKYIIKEYSLYVVKNKTYEVIRNDFEISRPPIEKDYLDEESQKKCTEYINEFGIDWDYGTRDYAAIKKHLQKEFRNLHKIYVINKTKHRLLHNYLNGKLRSKFVYMEKLGYVFTPKKGTTCSNHQEPFNKNCANDNVEEMLGWLQDNKPQAGNVRSLKLSGLTIPKFRRLTKQEVSGTTKQKYSKFRRHKSGRGTKPEVNSATNIVPIPSPIRRLSITSNLVPNSLSIQRTGSATNLVPSSSPTPKTNSARSLLPSPPIPKADNVINLVPSPPPIPKADNVINLVPSPPPVPETSSSRKLEVNGTEPAITNVTNSSKKHIIVDFYGYYVSENEYVIKELNAVVANKGSILDKDLYLFVKPPFADMEKLPGELFDAYLEFQLSHNFEWNDGEHDFETVSSILIDYFAAATHIYVQNLDKQQLLEKLIGTNHNFICLKDRGFEDLPENDSAECDNHFDDESICARKFSETMLQWVKKHVLNHDLNNVGGGPNYSHMYSTLN